MSLSHVYIMGLDFRLDPNQLNSTKDCRSHWLRSETAINCQRTST